MTAGPAMTHSHHASRHFTPTTYLDITRSSYYLTGSWRDQAACADMEPELWFPVSTETSSPVAKATCISCPVRLECLSYAMQTYQRDGMWGGVTPKNRRAIRRKLFKALKALGRSL